jgi:Arc/MetJ family transcription regulator
MKTTIDLPDALLEQAKRVAAARSTTIKSLVEAGLRRELGEQAKRARFELRDASFRGKGLHPEIEGASWEQLRALAYDQRGG